jgi:hypothetical protein
MKLSEIYHILQYQEVLIKMDLLLKRVRKNYEMEMEYIMKIYKIWFLTLLLSLFITACDDGGTNSTPPALQIIDAGDVNLGVSATLAVFGGSAGVTNAGLDTKVIGDMGTTGASTMITGFHSAVFSYTETPLNVGGVTGSVYTNAPEGNPATFAIATEMRADMLAAFNYLAAIPNGIDPGAGQLGGLILAPGVYKSASGAFLITGSDLTLDAQDNPDAVWVFQMASTLTVGDTAPRSVILINGAKSKNIYWQVGSTATINGAGGGVMVGNIIASAGMTFSTAGNATITILNGRALSLNASVTMVNTVVNTFGDSVPVDDVFIPPVANIIVSGTNAGNVTTTLTGAGFINVINNGGQVTVTETGIGTIKINNTSTGGILNVTNTGDGLITVNNSAIGDVVFSNTSNANITLTASGDATPSTYTWGAPDGLNVTVTCVDGVCTAVEVVK